MSEHSGQWKPHTQLLASIGQFIATTDKLTARQLQLLDWSKHLMHPNNEPDSRAQRLRVLVLDRRVQATIDKNVTLLSGLFEDLAPAGITPVVSDIQTGKTAVMGGLAYSVDERSYQALVGVSDSGEPIGWRLIDGEQLSLRPDGTSNDEATRLRVALLYASRNVPSHTGLPWQRAATHLKYFGTYGTTPSIIPDIPTTNQFTPIS